MSSNDVLLSKAWLKVTRYADSKLRLTDLLVLFDILEDMVHDKLLSDEYREFLVEFVMECPQVEVSQDQFRALMERLFECSLDDILNGRLVSRIKRQFDDFGSESRNGVDYGNRDEYTQTMNMESSKFNSFMSKGTLQEKEEILRARIGELESMLSRSRSFGSRDYRTTSKMKDILLDYYKNLDKITVLKNSSKNGTIDGNLAVDSVVKRLKNGIDKQDVLIGELKRKVGDDRPKGIFGQIRFQIVKVYLLIWRLVRIPLYIMISLLMLNFILYLVYDEGYVDNTELGISEEYWGSMQ